MWRYEGKIAVDECSGQQFELLKTALKKSRISFLAEAVVRTTDEHRVEVIVTPLCRKVRTLPDKVLSFCEALPKKIEAVGKTESRFCFVGSDEPGLAGVIAVDRKGKTVFMYGDEEKILRKESSRIA